MSTQRTHIPAPGGWFHSWTEATRRLRTAEGSRKPAQEARKPAQGECKPARDGRKPVQGDPLLDARTFLAQGRELLAEARRRGTPLALVMFQAPDMEALTLCLGAEAGNRIRRVFAGKLFTVAGELGIVGELRAGEFGLLLPLADETLAIRMVGAEFGTPAEVRTAVRLHEGDEPQDVSLWPHCLAARADTGARGLEQWLQTLRERLQAKAERTIALDDARAPDPAYAATVPASLAPLASTSALAAPKVELGEWTTTAFDMLPATVPMPLAMR